MRVEGTVYVLLTPDQVDRARSDAQESPVRDQAHPGAQTRPDDDQALHRLVDEQKEMIDWLRREVERKDTILMTLAQRVPEVEAAPEPRGDVLRNGEPTDGNGAHGAPDHENGQQKRSWWRRLLDIE